jgi:hypothetical protein
MKTTIIKWLVCFAILVGCNAKETENSNFKDFKLDLSDIDLDIDFTKPYTQSYSSDLKRDSITKLAAIEIFEGDATSVGKNESKIILFMLDFSAETKDVTSRLIFNEKEIDLTLWKKMAVFSDGKSLNTAMNQIISKKPSASFALRRDLNKKEIQLFYKDM